MLSRVTVLAVLLCVDPSVGWESRANARLSGLKARPAESQLCANARLLGLKARPAESQLWADARLSSLKPQSAEGQLPADAREGIDTAVRAAFAHLLALPRDTDAAAMGKWVLDSRATLNPDETPTRWTIVATHLIDTGRALKLNEEMGRQPSGATASQLAESAAAIERLEKEISRADADSRLEVEIDVNTGKTRATLGGDIDGAHTIQIAGAIVALQAPGRWIKSTDRALEQVIERWRAPSIIVLFASSAGADDRPIRDLVVHARGNAEMLEGLINETKWHALASLFPR